MITLSYYMPNESANAICVDLDVIRLYFSYDQIVAYWTEEDRLIVSANVWSRTTGKHINQLMKRPGHNTQVPVAEFSSRLHTLMRRMVFAFNHLELMRKVEESNEKAKRSSAR